jgi:hypothetical protein
VEAIVRLIISTLDQVFRFDNGHSSGRPICSFPSFAESGENILKMRFVGWFLLFVASDTTRHRSQPTILWVKWEFV